jgi:hypothetical protein
MQLRPKLIWIFVAIAFLLIISFYEWRLYLLDKRIKALQSSIASSVPSSISPQLSNSQSDYYPPVISENQPLPVVSAQKTSATSNKAALQDLFEAEKTPEINTPHNATDKIKTSYEELLVSYLFLKKCGKTTAQDYQLIISALQRDLSAQNATERLKYDILTAAKGSYDELYARSDCNEADVKSTYLGYSAYLNSLSQKNQ